MTEAQTERFAEALARLSGDRELLVAMAQMCVADAPEIVGALEQQLDQKAFDAAASTAHKLKGLCSTFETGAPVSDLEELIRAARSGREKEAQSTFASCRPGIDALLSEVSALTI